MVILFFMRVPLQIAWQIYSFSLMASIRLSIPAFFRLVRVRRFGIAYGNLRVSDFSH